ncbi:MAG: tRNA pseudouridine(55) synthase TruB [Ruminococcus sp.]|jgi:tRNA pseudouridine55 synthase
MNGIINVYKEAGYTSHDVVAKLRGILKQKKIGHTGTLDPDATGVLPVCLGKATKVCNLLADEKKTYEAVLRLGITTDTQDLSGTVIREAKVNVSGEETASCIESFLGEQMQIPPMYSALKVNGRKLYELAREGKTVERKARPVHFFSIEILEINLPRVRFLVTCSKGTYIRTLCHDIGEKLGCGGCMESLERTKVGRFERQDSWRLTDIEAKMRAGEIEDCILPVDRMFEDLPAITVQGKIQQRVYNGNVFHGRYLSCDDVSRKDGQQVRIYDSQGGFVGLYQYRKEADEFCPVKMFRDGGGRS